MPIRQSVVICVQHLLMGRLLQSELRNDYDVLGVYTELGELVAGLRTHTPDIVICQLYFNGGHIGDVRRMLDEQHEAMLIGLDSSMPGDHVLSSITRSVADTTVTSEHTPTELKRAIRECTPLGRTTYQQISDRDLREILTRRGLTPLEVKVAMLLITTHLTPRGIATQLGITYSSVKHAAARGGVKLDLETNSRVSLLKWFREQHIIT